MNFDLNEEQRDILEVVQRFAEQEMKPYAEQWDEQHTFPRAVYVQMAELGLLGMTTPEAYGGNALSRLTAAMVYEKLAQGDMATAAGLSVHNMVAGSLVRFSTEEQRRRWVPRLAAGELLGAFSLSEAASGSDAASLQCRAERVGDHYVINGSKMWVTNGGEADLYLLMARSGGTGAAGISCFVVEKGTPGFT
ncbi:MAG TPA: acyl-CoA dehydrogenase family protein, partial [Ktedonobacteraceae bacterium]|nr:acyl-CoA dehydrogenase family protein [Ktedonobacteraceae bacterium]